MLRHCYPKSSNFAKISFDNQTEGIKVIQNSSNLNFFCRKFLEAINKGTKLSTYQWLVDSNKLVV